MKSARNTMTRLFQIDAFSSALFAGNPAAVVPLDQPLSTPLMHAIAAENNLSETAFFWPEPGEADFRLRWFTPEAEVDLCGHATLATAWLLQHELGWTKSRVSFATRSGILQARWTVAGRTQIDLPSRPIEAATAPAALLEGLGAAPEQVYCGANWLCVYPSEDHIRQLQPGMEPLTRIGPHGVIVTAPGESVDFVSRYFVPAYGIDEDPVTGSAHCDLFPYWSARLQRDHLHARQLSARGGDLELSWNDDQHSRVLLSGDCRLYLRGQINLPDDITAG